MRLPERTVDSHAHIICQSVRLILAMTLACLFGSVSAGEALDPARLCLTRPRVDVPARELDMYRRNFQRPELAKWREALIKQADPQGKWRTMPEAALTHGDDTLGECIPGYKELAACRLAYLATGEAQYREAALEWLTTALKWDAKKGPSAYGSKVGTGVDLAREVIGMMAPAYDTFHADMPPDLKQAVRENLVLRCRDWFGYFAANDPLSYGSHHLTTVAVFAKCAIALYGDEPEASNWLAWVVDTYSHRFPRWGGADGGWSEGISYLMSSAHHLEAVGALQRFGAGDITAANPWFQNFLRYFMYLHPVHLRYGKSERGVANSWGDAASCARGIAAKSRLVAWLASDVLQQPAYRWWAENVLDDTTPNSNLLEGGTKRPDQFMALAVREFESAVKPRPPADWPLSCHFKDVGVVAMRLNLVDSSRDVAFCFKASPPALASVSHGHGDQNSFYLHAYNRPLAIVAGFYNGDDATQGENGLTRYKNTLIFDGKGQPWLLWKRGPQPPLKAEIVKYEEKDTYVYAVGEAAGAYRENYECKAGESTQPFVKRFRRYAVMVRRGKNELPYCIVADDVALPGAMAATWLLHSAQEMTLAKGELTLDLRYDQARCRVKLLAGDKPTAFAQTRLWADRPNVVKEYKGFEQWQAAVTFPASDRRRIVAVLMPYQAGEEAKLPGEFSAQVADEGRCWLLGVGADRLEIRFGTDEVLRR
jgi:hypothetical protein